MTVAGGEGWVCDTEGALARFGRVMPRSARETDFFLVLTGMMKVMMMMMMMMMAETR